MNTELTPVEKRGNYWIKRDDLYHFAGCYGGKVRTCRVIAEKAKAKGIEGLTTAASRESPQAKITAAVAHALGMKARCHIPTAKTGLDQKMIDAQNLGAELVYQRPGYNSVLKARARLDAEERGWAEIPFGMECREAIEQNALQTENIPEDIERIVIPVGSGATVSGVLTGLKRRKRQTKILGVSVGADPYRMLNAYVPFWSAHLRIVRSSYDYHDKVTASIEGIELDEIYEAKCVEYLKPGDLMWIVGRR